MNTRQWWPVVSAWGGATRCRPGGTTRQGAPGACVTEVAQVWTPTYDVVGGACAEWPCSQGLLVHPKNCRGYSLRHMACGARLGRPGMVALGIPLGRQNAVCLGWSCPGGAQ